ncbi:hypothetical protein [Peribacillus sp. NPDC096540]
MNKKGTEIKSKYSVQIAKQKTGTKVSDWATWLDGDKKYQITPVQQP